MESICFCTLLLLKNSSFIFKLLDRKIVIIIIRLHQSLNYPCCCPNIISTVNHSEDWNNLLKQKLKSLIIQTALTFTTTCSSDTFIACMFKAIKSYSSTQQTIIRSRFLDLIFVQHNDLHAGIQQITAVKNPHIKAESRCFGNDLKSKKAHMKQCDMIKHHYHSTTM